MDKVRLSDYMPVPSGVDQYSREFIDKQEMLVLRKEADKMLIGITEPEKSRKMFLLQRYHGVRVDFVQLGREELLAYLGRLEIRQITSAEAVYDNPENLGLMAINAPIVNITNSILLEGLRRRATDIHLEPDTLQAQVRYRVDGILESGEAIPASAFAGVCSRLKVMAGLDISESRRPQDGRFSIQLAERLLDVRISILPSAPYEAVVLRLLERNSLPLRLNELGFSKDICNEISELIYRNHGLFLICGPTGCGKTTTLNACIRELQDDFRKIVTIEDPVEYRFDGIVHIQVNETIGVSFSSLLKRVLRHDPDIIVIGELRDQATAELALRASLTGHLVLTSLHCYDTAACERRLNNLGLSSRKIEEVLIAALAQRLPRKNCRNCLCSYKPSVDERERLADAGFKTKQLYRSFGCKQCQTKGFSSRTAIAELRRFNPSVFYRSIYKDGYEKALEGITTLAEVDRVLS